MENNFRHVTISQELAGAFHTLEWRLGEPRPSVTALIRDRDSMESREITVSAEAVAHMIHMAERLMIAADQALTTTPRADVDLAFSPGFGISAGYWVTVMGAPDRRACKEETMRRIQQAFEQGEGE